MMKDSNVLLQYLIESDVTSGWWRSTVLWHYPVNEVRWLKVMISKWKIPNCPSIKDWYLVPECEINEGWESKPMVMGPEYVGAWAQLAGIDQDELISWNQYLTNSLVHVRIREFSSDLNIKCIFTISCTKPNIVWSEFLPETMTERPG